MGLENIRIKPRLLASFLVMAAFALFIGIFGITVLRTTTPKLVESAEILKAYINYPEQLLKDLFNMRMLVRSAEIDLLKNNFDISFFDAEILRLRTSTTETFDKLSSFDMNAESKKQFETVKVDIVVYREAVNAWADVVRITKMATAQSEEKFIQIGLIGNRFRA